MKQLKKIISIILISALTLTAALALSSCGGSGSSGGSNGSGSSGGGGKSELEKTLDGVCEYMESTLDGNYRPGESGSDWSVIVYSMAGRDFDYKGYLDGMAKHITECYKTEDKLDSGNRPTEWERDALAVIACGGDPQAIGEDENGDKVNLIKDGIYDWKQTKDLGDQGSNALIYALITLDAGGIEVPEGSRYTREAIIDELLQYQYNDGSYALGQGEKGSVDITAMAVRALAPYVDKNQRVQESVNLAVAYLSQEQEGSGLFISGENYSSETLSQVILALAALGRDPAEDEEFSKSGNSIMDALMMFKMDDGSFSHEIPDDTSVKGDNLMSSQQAGQAIAAVVELQKKQNS